jgi:hypothetical protein
MPSARLVIVVRNAGLIDAAPARCGRGHRAFGACDDHPLGPDSGLRRAVRAALLRLDHENGTVALDQNDILDTGVEVIGGQTFVLEGARY